jgi:hypothetical protein
MMSFQLIPASWRYVSPVPILACISVVYSSDFLASSSSGAPALGEAAPAGGAGGGGASPLLPLLPPVARVTLGGRARRAGERSGGEGAATDSLLGRGRAGGRSSPRRAGSAAPRSAPYLPPRDAGAGAPRCARHRCGPAGGRPPGGGGDGGRAGRRGRVAAGAAGRARCRRRGAAPRRRRRCARGRAGGGRRSTSAARRRCSPGAGNGLQRPRPSYPHAARPLRREATTDRGEKGLRGGLDGCDVSWMVSIAASCSLGRHTGRAGRRGRRKTLCVARPASSAFADAQAPDRRVAWDVCVPW